MICSKCKDTVYHATSYTDSNGVWQRVVCDKCSGKTSRTWSTMDKIKSRSLMPDGTVLTGREGMRVKDARLRAQNANT